MDKNTNIDWTLIAETLGGDQDAVKKARQLSLEDATFKSVLSEVTEIWKQSNTIGQGIGRKFNSSQLDHKVNEIWTKILEEESEETQIATSLECENSEADKDVKNIWNAATSIGQKQRKEVSTEEMDAAMAKMLLRMNLSEKEEQTKTATFKVEKTANKKVAEETSLWSFPNSMAAAVAILLTVGLSMFYFLGSDQAEMLIQETGNTTALVNLPDGTQVWLNKNSSIKYPQSFGDADRTVALTGDAFFEVKRDVAHPFHIVTGVATTTVLGTSFHLTNDKVEVVTGKVRFESKTSGEYVVLVKNEKGAITNTGVKKSAYEAVNATSLMQSELTFEGSSLSNAINVIAKAYGKSIVIDSEALKTRKFTGLFKNKSFEKVLSQLTEVVGCSSEVLEDGTIVLK